MLHAVLPVPPDAAHFMWQGRQTSFLDEMNNPCTASVAIAVGDQATCYAAAGGTLRCAGKIDTNVYGSSFTDVPGVSNVDQILLSPTGNGPDNNSICVRTTGGTAMCMGGRNDWGQLGVGDQNPSAVFAPWGMVNGVVALATGTWDQMCAATSGAGKAFCAGYGQGPTPVPVFGSAASLWVDITGTANANDAAVFRAVNSRTGCQVRAQGLSCIGGVLGNAGDVVDGTETRNVVAPGVPLGGSRYCVLSGKGTVTCNTYDGEIDAPMPTVTTPFTQHPVLALAGNEYTISICAVYNDGSIACMGKNDVGQLGLPAQAYVDVETIVQPPGSIDVTCN